MTVASVMLYVDAGAASEITDVVDAVEDGVCGRSSAVSIVVESASVGRSTGASGASPRSSSSVRGLSETSEKTSSESAETFGMERCSCLARFRVKSDLGTEGRRDSVKVVVGRDSVL